MLALDSHARIAAAVASVPMLALWGTLRKQSRQLGELREQLNTSREEVLTRRSTMRFIFDELLPHQDNMPPRIRHAQRQIERSLSAAGGLVELLGHSLEDPPQSVRRIYLRELAEALRKCESLNLQMVVRGPATVGVRPERTDAAAKRTGRPEEFLTG